MKLAMILGGILLLLISSSVMAGRFSFVKDEPASQVSEYGGIEQTERGIPSRFGYLGFALGGMLTVGGFLRKT